MRVFLYPITNKRDRVFCVWSLTNKGNDKGSTTTQENDTKTTNNDHNTPAYNNSATQGQNSPVNEYNETKHKTKAQRIDRSEADRVEH